jgi:two-component system OmpR family response regulator
MATNVLHQQHPSSSTSRHTLLIAGAAAQRRRFLASQLDADGHTVYDAAGAEAAVSRLSACPIDVLILGELQRPAEAPGLLRALRSGEHPQIHPGLPVITLGAGDELTALRAYESGSDHHLPESTGYVLLREVLTSVVRRAFEDLTPRYLQAGEIHVDLAPRSVDVAGTVVRLSRLEFELLVKFANDPVRVFRKDELARCIWRCDISGRTVESHVARLRTRLSCAGAGSVLVNTWGHGWSLTRPS